MDKSPVLHVVYAGYGDAFILEYGSPQERKFILVDGGPKGRLFSSSGQPPARYPIYFVNAVSNIWADYCAAYNSGQQPDKKNAQTIAPTAIVNSHPDHDHYEGLLYLIKELWPDIEEEGRQQPQRSLSFKGPFVLPLPQNKNFMPLKVKAAKKVLDHIWEPLQKRGFNRWLHWDPETEQDVNLHITYPDEPDSVASWTLALSSTNQETKTIDPKPVEIQMPLEESDGEEVVQEEPDEYSYVLGRAMGSVSRLPVLQIKKPVNADIDKSKTNLSSILLHTTDMTGGRIFMTGDSVGWRVSQKLLDEHPGSGRPHVNIYKVQHHGSIKNSQLVKSETKIAKEIAVEVALRELMEIGFGAYDEPPGAPPAYLEPYFSRSCDLNIPLPEVNECCKTVCETLLRAWMDKNTQPQSGTPSEDDLGWEYLGWLRQRHLIYIDRFTYSRNDNQHQSGFTLQNIFTDEIIEQARNQNLWKKPGWAPEPYAVWDSLIDTKFKRAQEIVDLRMLQLLWKKFVKWASPEATTKDESVEKPIVDAGGFYDIHMKYTVALSSRMKKDQPPPDDMSLYAWTLLTKAWWTKWHGANLPDEARQWLAYYSTLAAVSRVADFYRTFTADAYVISANGTHGHPDTATILGIAKATYQDELERVEQKLGDHPIRRTLYVTSGHALPIVPMRAVANHMPEFPFDEILGPDGCLVIRYLSSHIYMSLSGAGNQTDEREFTNHTRVWSVEETNSAEAAHTALEWDRAILPRAREKDGVFCVLATQPDPKSDSTYFLQVQPKLMLTEHIESVDVLFLRERSRSPVLNKRMIDIHSPPPTVSFWTAYYTVQHSGGFALFFADKGVLHTWYKDGEIPQFLPEEKAKNQKPVSFFPIEVQKNAFASDVPSPSQENEEVVDDGESLELISQTVAMLQTTPDHSSSAQSGITITRPLSASKVVLGPNVQQILTYVYSKAGANLEPGTLGFPKLLAFLTRRTPRAVANHLLNTMPTVLIQAGLLKTAIDIDRSTAVAWLDPAGGLVVDSADLVCDGSKLLHRTGNILAEIAGLKIEFGDVTMKMQDAYTSQETLTLSSMVLISSVRLASSVTVFINQLPNTLLDAPAVRWAFTAVKTTSLASITALWADNKANLEHDDRPIPFTDKTLSNLEHSEVGFVIAQPVAQVAQYNIWCIWAATTLDDWKSYLPKDFLPSEIGAGLEIKARLEVKSPLDKESRAFGAAVEFKVPIETTAGQSRLMVALSAEPLAIPTNYDYRLEVSASEAGVTLRDLVKKVGIDYAVEKLADDIPLVQDVMTKLAFKRLGIGLVRFDKTCIIRDFALSVTVGQLQLSDALLIEFVELELEYRFGAWEGKCHGEMTIGEKSTSVDVVLPNSTQSGMVRVTALNGLSIYDVMKPLEVPSLERIPIIGDLLRTELVSMSLDVEKYEKKAEITGWAFELHHPGITIGSFALTQIDARIESGSLVNRDGKSILITSFVITAIVPSGLFNVAVSYNTHLKKLTAALQATSKGVSVSDTIGHILGTEAVSNGLKDIIGDLSVSAAGVEFDVANNFAPNMVNIHVADTAAVTVDKMTLRSLHLDYIASRPAVNDKPRTPSLFNLVGVIGNEKTGLQVRLTCALNDPSMGSVVELALEPDTQNKFTLDDVISVFGLKRPELDEPSGFKDPGFFDSLNIYKVSGSVASSTSDGKKITQLQNLHIVVASNAAFLETGVRLERVSVAAHYELGKPLTADIWGFLTVEDNMVVALRYTAKDSIHRFLGDLSWADKSDSSRRPDYRKMVKYLGDKNVSIPGNAGIPPELPMSGMGIFYEPKKFLAIETYGGPRWQISLFRGLGMVIKDLAGVFKADFADNTYDARLGGSLEFKGFASFGADLQISSTKRPVLTANLQKQGTDNGISNFLDDLSEDKDLWAKLTPADTKSIRFDEDNLGLMLDFQSSTFILTGHVGDLGIAFLLATVVDKKHECLLYLKITNIAALWPQLQEILEKWITFETFTVQISTKELKVQTLKEQVGSYAQALTDGDPQSKNSKDLSDAIENIPADQLIPRGGCLHTTIALASETPISEMLTLSAMENAKPRMYLDAVIPTDKGVSAAEYLVSIKHLHLFGGAIVISEATGQWKAMEHELFLHGSLALTIEGNSEPFHFDIDFTTDEKTTKFTFSTGQENVAVVSGNSDTKPDKSGTNTDSDKRQPTKKTPVMIRNAFGGVFDLALEVSSFKGTISKITKGQVGVDEARPKASSVFELSGQIKIGSRLVQGEIYFIAGVPKLLSIFVDANTVIPIADIFTNIIAGSTGNPSTATTWPPEYGTLNLKKIAMQYSSYDKDFQRPDSSTTYNPGFHVLAEIEIFKVGFEINAHLPNDRSGLRMTGATRDVLDVGFLKLSEKKAETVQSGDASLSPKGPKVTIVSQKSAPKMYEVAANVQVFDKAGFKVDLKYSTGVFVGDATYDGTIEILGASVTPRVTVKYANGKFSFQGLEVFQDLNLDIQKALQEASKEYKTECKDLLKLILNKLVKTKFSWSLGVEGIEKTSVTVSIEGTFTVSLVEDATVIGKFKLPLIAPVPFADFKFDSLIKLLGKAMEDNLTRLGQAVLEQPDQASILIGSMAAEKWGAQIIGSLLCRGINPPNVYRRAWDMTHRKDDDPDTGEKSPWSSFKDIQDALKILTTAGILLAVAISSFLDMLATYGGFMTAAEALCWMIERVLSRLPKDMSALGKGYSSEEFKKILEDFKGMMEEAKNSRVKAQDHIRQSLNLSNTPEATLIGKGTTLRLDWNKGLPQRDGKPLDLTQFKPDSLQWEVYISKTNRPPVNSTSSPSTNLYRTTETSIQIHHPDVAANKQIYAWVRAKYSDSKGSVASAEWKEAKVPGNIPRLPQPSSVTLSLDTKNMACIVTVPNAVPGSYVMTLNMIAAGELAESNNKVAERVVVCGTAGQDVTLTVPSTELNWQHLMFTPFTNSLRLEAQAYLRSDNVSSARSSLVSSSNQLGVAPPPADFTCKYVARGLTGNWVEVQGTQNYQVLLKQDGDELHQMEVAIPGFSIPAADAQIKRKGYINIFVRQVLPNKVIVALWAQTSVQVVDLPTPAVSRESFFDVPTQTLLLVIYLGESSDAANVNSFLLSPLGDLAGGDAELPAPHFIYEFEDHRKGPTAIVLLKVPLAAVSSASGTPYSFKVSAVDEDGLVGTASEPCILLPMLPKADSLRAVTATAKFLDRNTLRVSWRDVPEGVTRVVVDVVERENEAHIGRDVTASDLGTEIKATEFNLIPGQVLSIVCTSWFEIGIRGGVIRLEDITVPEAQ